MISVVDAITPELDEGRMKWEEYSTDSAHPNDYGHKLISEFIGYMFKTADNAASEKYAIPSEAIYGTRYANAEMATLGLNNDNIKITDNGDFSVIDTAGNGFPGYWEYKSRSDAGGAPIKLTAKGSSFFLIYKTNNNDKMGVVDVYVNGELAKTISSKEEYGWGGPAAAVVVQYDDVRDMDIEIRPADSETGKTVFTVYGFAVSQD